MPDVEGQVAPDIRRGHGNRAPSVKTERQQTDHAPATVSQCSNQLLRPNLLSIDGSGRRDAKFLSQRLNPGTPGIVYVTGNHPNGSSWSPRYCCFPYLFG